MADKFPKHVFTSLSELLSLEAFARGFSFQAKKQKVRSVLGGKHASKLRGRGMDFEEVRQYVVVDSVVKNGEIKETGDQRFIRMTGKFINIDELNIDLIDTINPFQQAFEILSKSNAACVL